MRRVVQIVVLALIGGLLVAACAGASAPLLPAEGVNGVGTSAPGAGPVTQSDAKAAESGGSAAQSWDRYVIRSGNLRLVVEDVESAAERVKQLAADAGGFVAQSNSRRDGEKVFIELVIQVPAEKFDQTVNDLRALALTVERANTSTEDVTEEFIDNEARLRNLRAAEESTLRLLERTQDMDDILSVERELTRLRGEIESIEGRQRYLERRVAMSSITVSLIPPAAAALAAERASWRPFDTAAIAWEDSLNFLMGAIDFLLAALIFFWWAIPLVVAAVVIWRRRRRSRAVPPLKSQGAT